jgi:hypothetical protein
MADDRTKRGAAERQKVAGGQDHEVRHLAGKFGISTDQAKALVEQYGNNRERLEAAVRKLAD